MNLAEGDPAELVPERPRLVASLRSGAQARKAHAVPEGGKVALCGARADTWRLAPGGVVGCPSCLEKLARQAAPA